MDEPNEGPEIPADHWVNKETHEKLVTPEAKQALSKYKTREDAIAGGLEAMKVVGRPFKIPESLADVEKWPDKKDQEGFRTGLDKLLNERVKGGALNKLLGAVETAEDLKDINFAAGLPEGQKPNEALIGVLSNFAVEQHVPKALVAKYIEHSNKASIEIGAKMAAAQEAALLAKAKEADDALIANPAYGTIEKVQAADELVRRMFQNNLGLNAEEYEQAAGELVNANFTQNVILRRALHAAARQLVKEGENHIGAGGGKEKEKIKTTAETTDETLAAELAPTYKALGWKKPDNKK
ncbi:MAG: hypothetical protein PHY02_09770 [Phycisphaerae bacterium]|nr:hypothetical protein [Phycisphaerae bacterium]